MKLEDIKTDVLFLTRTVKAQYTDAELLRSINSGYDDLVLQIWKSDNEWRYDEGVDHLPIACANLVKGQRDYQIPSEARTIERVEVNMGGENIRLSPMPEDDPGTHENKEGTPRFYYIKGRSLYLFPTADKAVDEGLCVYLSKSVNPLEEDTDEVKVDREFVRYIIMSAVRDWFFSTKQTREYRNALNEIERMKQDIQDFYSKRNRGLRKGFKVRRQNYL